MFKFPDWKFTLYSKEFEVLTEDGVDWFKPYVHLYLYVNKHTGFHFSCQIPNRSYQGKNPFEVILRATGELVKRELKLDRRLGE
jgi:hypothetical protein